MLGGSGEVTGTTHHRHRNKRGDGALSCKRLHTPSPSCLLFRQSCVTNTQAQDSLNLGFNSCYHRAPYFNLYMYMSLYQSHKTQTSC